MNFLTNKILLIKGECTGKYAAEKLFSNFSSIKEIRKCSRNGCNFNNVIHRLVLSITINSANLKKLKSSIKTYFQRTQKVNAEMCDVQRTSIFEVSGNHCIIELINAEINSASAIADV